jgi:hypothetical protein
MKSCFRDSFILHKRQIIISHLTIFNKAQISKHKYFLPILLKVIFQPTMGSIYKFFFCVGITVEPSSINWYYIMHFPNVLLKY